MQPAVPTTIIAKVFKRADLLLAAGLFGTVLMLVVPVPPFLIDALLALSIGVVIARRGAYAVLGAHR
jgi:flagellar biosynthesis protein FlhA